MIGDDINDRYSSQFNRMIKSLNLSPDTAYEAFAGIARRSAAAHTMSRDARVVQHRPFECKCELKFRTFLAV